MTEFIKMEKNRILIIQIQIAILEIIAICLFSNSGLIALKIVGYLLLILIPQIIFIYLNSKDVVVKLSELCREIIDNITRGYDVTEADDSICGVITYRPFVASIIIDMLNKGINSCHAAPVNA